jgi:hypothetical protein
MDKEELFKDMTDLWNNFVLVRSTYPYVRPDNIGQTFLQSAPYYQNRGLNLIDILRRLRRYFSHTRRFNPEDPDQIKLRDRIIEHFQLEIYDTDILPIPTDKVVEVIFIRAKKYVDQL